MSPAADRSTKAKFTGFAAHRGHDAGARVYMESKLYDDIQGAPTPPELEGYLSKLKHKTALMGGWTKRYFRVEPSTVSLDYYQSEGAARSRAPPSGSSLGLTRRVEPRAVGTPSVPRPAAPPHSMPWPTAAPQ